MPSRFEQPDSPEPEWDEEDRDGPQECDLTADRDEETPTVPCPGCDREIPDFVDRCPYCGDWVVQSSGAPARRSPWFILLVLVAVVLILMLWVF